MAYYYFSVNVDNDRMLCIAPLTDDCIERSGQELSDEGGYFLYEKRRSNAFANVEIIAHLLSEEAAFKLRDIFNMS